MDLFDKLSVEAIALVLTAVPFSFSFFIQQLRIRSD